MMKTGAKVGLLGACAICLVECGGESAQISCPELNLYNVRDASSEVWDTATFRAAVDAGCVIAPIPPSTDAGASSD